MISKLKLIVVFGCFSFYVLGCSSDEITTRQEEVSENEQDNHTNEPSFSITTGVGNSAVDLLTENTFTKLNVEIGYMEGFSISSEAEEELKRFLEEFLNKSEGVEITQTQIPSQSKESYSAQDLRAIEAENRQLVPVGNELSVWISVVDGEFESANVIGVAYQNLSASLMGKTIADNTGGLTQASRSSVETAILNHEIGHLLGLVNITTPMVNDHQANGNHCDNSNCLMNASLETTDMFSIIANSPIPQLDENCQQDLIANGGK